MPVTVGGRGGGRRAPPARLRQPTPLPARGRDAARPARAGRASPGSTRRGSGRPRGLLRDPVAPPRAAPAPGPGSTRRGTGAQVGRPNSHTTSRPPGLVTRASSASARSGSVTLRRPKEIVTASNTASANGRASASAATFGTAAAAPGAEHAEGEVGRDAPGAGAGQLDGRHGGARGQVQHRSRRAAGPARGGSARASGGPARR